MIMTRNDYPHIILSKTQRESVCMCGSRKKLQTTGPLHFFFIFFVCVSGSFRIHTIAFAYKLSLYFLRWIFVQSVFLFVHSLYIFDWKKILHVDRIFFFSTTTTSPMPMPMLLFSVWLPSETETVEFHIFHTFVKGIASQLYFSLFPIPFTLSSPVINPSTKLKTRGERETTQSTFFSVSIFLSFVEPLRQFFVFMWSILTRHDLSLNA